MAPPSYGRGIRAVAGATVGAAVAHSMYPYWLQDIRAIRTQKASREKVDEMLKAGRYLVDVFSEAVRNHPHKLCVIHERRLYTYGDIDRLSNKFAHLLRRRGMKCGDRIAIFMYNEPAFIWSYLGCAKLGISCAFINYNLRAEPLVHCLDISEARVVVVGHDIELFEALRGDKEALGKMGFSVLSIGPNPDSLKYDFVEPIDQQIDLSPDDPIPTEMRSGIKPSDVAALIYTSGTTGLPKAAKITYHRQLRTFASVPELRPDDRIYLFLPLYHSNAFLSGLGNSLRLAATIVLSQKFSVTHFWEDCCRYGVTYFLYIGEICRYLLSRPESPLDRKHCVRMITGNGLRPDIWQNFKTRFNIPIIHEFYGSTEGPIFLRNSDNKIGAVGKVSPLVKRRMGIELVEYDYDTAEPLRDTNGRCIPVKLGSPGLLIGTISESAPFDGYLGPSDQTDKKIIKNAFKDGDEYYNSGDLLMIDKNYYVYFVDRVGDTFRWKGENVATTEVGHVVASFKDVEEANVYGVEIPGQDGRAGMAAIVLRKNNQLDCKKLYAHVRLHLPSYACPMFIRVQPSMDVTGTFKHRKIELVEQGFDPNIIREPLFFLDSRNKTYSELHVENFKRFIIGKARL